MGYDNPHQVFNTLKEQRINISPAAFLQSHAMYLLLLLGNTQVFTVAATIPHIQQESNDSDYTEGDCLVLPGSQQNIVEDRLQVI